MEYRNCAAGVAQSTPPSQPMNSTSLIERSYNGNSLNAALAFQLYTSASYRYDLPRSETNNELSDDFDVTPLRQYRPFRTSMQSPNSTRELSDILDEAINISNEILLQNCDDAPRVLSSPLPHRQQEPQGAVSNQQQKRGSRKVQHRRPNLPQQ